jgi:DNA-binding NarL/FixJ family response regulator
MPIDPRPTRLILVEDDAAFRAGLRDLVCSQPGLEVAAEADTAEAAIEAVARCTADIVVLDLSLPRLDGFEVLRRIRSISNTIKVLVLSMYRLDDVAASAFAAGADGYCTKATGRDGLLAAISDVAAGRRVCCLE